MPRFARLRALVVVAGAGLVLCLPAAASAAQAGRPTVGASVTGSLEAGARVEFHVKGTVAGGWQNLYQLRVVLVLHRVTLEEIDYIQDETSITEPGALPAQVGTPELVEGPFFKFTGLDVQTSTGGDSIALTIRASVLHEIPPGAAFRFEAVADNQAAAAVTRPADVRANGSGFSWGTLAAAVLAALFLGGFLGNSIASHRRRAVRPSVYTSIQRKIAEERAGT